PVLVRAPQVSVVYSLSLTDALPIFMEQGVLLEHLCPAVEARPPAACWAGCSRATVPGSITVPDPPISPRPGSLGLTPDPVREPIDRKSTRLNSSHGSTSYAVFCLKK